MTVVLANRVSNRLIAAFVLAAVWMGILSMPAHATASEPAAVSAIVGTVWTDVNRNGQMDPNEPIESGAYVFLEEQGNGDDRDVIATAVVLTDGQGNYDFGQVTPGEYRLWVQTTRTQTQPRSVTVGGDVEGASSINIDLEPHTVMLPMVVNR